MQWPRPGRRETGAGLVRMGHSLTPVPSPLREEGSARLLSGTPRSACAEQAFRLCFARRTLRNDEPGRFTGPLPSRGVSLMGSRDLDHRIPHAIPRYARDQRFSTGTEACYTGNSNRVRGERGEAARLAGSGRRLPSPDVHQSPASPYGAGRIQSTRLPMKWIGRRGRLPLKSHPRPSMVGVGGSRRWKGRLICPQSGDATTPLSGQITRCFRAPRRMRLVMTTPAETIRPPDMPTVCSRFGTSPPIPTNERL